MSPEMKRAEAPKIVRDLLERKGQSPIYTTIATQSVSEANSLMRDHNVRSLLVLDGENRLWGIVTRTDIDLKVNLEGLNPNEARVGQIMTPIEKIVTVDIETDLEECKALMKQHKIRHLPVVKQGDIPEGIISTTDFAFSR